MRAVAEASERWPKPQEKIIDALQLQVRIAWCVPWNPRRRMRICPEAAFQNKAPAQCAMALIRFNCKSESPWYRPSVSEPVNAIGAAEKMAIAALVALVTPPQEEE